MSLFCCPRRAKISAHAPARTKQTPWQRRLPTPGPLMQRWLLNTSHRPPRNWLTGRHSEKVASRFVNIWWSFDKGQVIQESADNPNGMLTFPLDENTWLCIAQGRLPSCRRKSLVSLFRWLEWKWRGAEGPSCLSKAIVIPPSLTSWQECRKMDGQGLDGQGQAEQDGKWKPYNPIGSRL